MSIFVTHNRMALGRPTGYILDRIEGAVIAYSLRKLTATGNKCLQLYNSSGSSTNILFNSAGGLNESDFETHCTGGVLTGLGRARRFYNQLDEDSHELITPGDYAYIYDYSGEGLYDGLEYNNLTGQLVANSFYSVSNHASFQFDEDSSFTSYVRFNCIDTGAQSGTGALFCKGIDLGAFGHALRVDVNPYPPKLRSGVRAADGTARYATSDTIDKNVYISAIMTYSSRTIKNYMNGVQWGSDIDVETGETFGTTTPLRSIGNGHAFVGSAAPYAKVRLQEAVMFNRVLTASEITLLSAS